MAEKFPPSFTVCKLYERTSAKGKSYLTGRWGGCRVAMIKTDQTDNDGNPVWEMRMSEAPAYVPREATPEAIPAAPRKLLALEG